MSSPYQILGVAENSSFTQVKNAFRKLSLDCHPDINGDTQENIDKFYAISEAYNTIKSDARKIYDLLDIDFHSSYEEIDAKFRTKLDQLRFKISKNSDAKHKEDFECLRKSYNLFKSSVTKESKASW